MPDLFQMVARNTSLLRPRSRLDVALRACTSHETRTITNHFYKDLLFGACLPADTCDHKLISQQFKQTQWLCF